MPYSYISSLFSDGVCCSGGDTVVAIVVTAFVAVFIVVVASTRYCQKSGIRQLFGTEATLQEEFVAIFLFNFPWFGFILYSHVFERLSEVQLLCTLNNEHFALIRY